MLSGVITNTFEGTWKLIAEWTATQNIENNYSEVTVNFYLTGDYAIRSSSTNNGYITIDGSRYNFTANSSINGGQKKLLKSVTKKVYHDNIGEKTFKIYASYDLKVTLSGTYIGTRHVEGNFILNDIARASTISTIPAEFDIDSSFNIGIQRASSSFTHKLIAYVGTKYIGEWDGATSIDVALNSIRQDRVYEEIPNSLSATLTLKLITYKGTKQIGSSTSETITAKVPDSIKPYFSSIGHKEDNIKVINSNVGLYVKGLSQLKIWFKDATSPKFTTIKEYSINFNGKNYRGSTKVTDKVTKSGILSITATLTDSRNRKFTRILDVTVEDYKSPDISKVEPLRYLNSSGTEDGMGTFLGVDILGQITSLKIGTTEKNTSTVRIYSKLKSSTSWTVLYNNTNFNLSLMSRWGYYSGYIIDKAYDVRVEIEDKFNIVRVDRILPTAIATGELGKTGMSIGTLYKDEEGVLQLASPYGQNDAHKLINYSGGYYLYRDNVSLAGAVSRMWFSGPDNGEYVFSCRLASESLKQIRFRAEKFNFEIGNIFTGEGGDTYNLSENGYSRLLNGLILQWGRVRYDPAVNNGFVQITFPISFPNSVLSIKPSVEYISGFALDVILSTQVNSNSQAYIYARNVDRNNPTKAFDIRYMIIGY